MCGNGDTMAKMLNHWSTAIPQRLQLAIAKAQAIGYSIKLARWPNGCKFLTNQTTFLPTYLTKVKGLIMWIILLFYVTPLPIRLELYNLSLNPLENRCYKLSYWLMARSYSFSHQKSHIQLLFPSKHISYPVPVVMGSKSCSTFLLMLIFWPWNHFRRRNKNVIWFGIRLTPLCMRVGMGGPESYLILNFFVKSDFILKFGSSYLIFAILFKFFVEG